MCCTESSLEGWLLARWSKGGTAGKGHPAYDAHAINHLPSPSDLLTYGGSAPDNDSVTTAPSLTLLVNQTAVHALPAALSQASSVLLRYMEAEAARLTGRDVAGAAMSDIQVGTVPRLLALCNQPDTAAAVNC